MGFILGAMLRQVATERPFDESRAYLSGYSCGCYMVQTLAYQASDLIAGAACMAGYLVPALANSPRPSTFSPVPLLEIQGRDDPIVTFSASDPAADPNKPNTGVGAMTNLETWRNLDGCSQSSMAENQLAAGVTMTSYSDCSSGVETALIVLDGVQHCPYRGCETSFDTTQAAWNFLRRFRNAL